MFRILGYKVFRSIDVNRSWGDCTGLGTLSCCNKRAASRPSEVWYVWWRIGTLYLIPVLLLLFFWFQFETSMRHTGCIWCHFFFFISPAALTCMRLSPCASSQTLSSLVTLRPFKDWWEVYPLIFPWENLTPSLPRHDVSWAWAEITKAPSHT